MANEVKVKLFVGWEIKSEIKMHLSQSPLWKDAQIIGKKDLIETRFQEKSYIGKLLVFSEVTTKDLVNEGNYVLEKLSEYCPSLKINKNACVIFSQVYIA